MGNLGLGLRCRVKDLLFEFFLLHNQAQWLIKRRHNRQISTFIRAPLHIEHIASLIRGSNHLCSECFNAKLFRLLLLNFFGSSFLLANWRLRDTSDTYSALNSFHRPRFLLHSK